MALGFPQHYWFWPKNFGERTAHPYRYLGFGWTRWGGTIQLITPWFGFALEVNYPGPFTNMRESFIWFGYGKKSMPSEGDILFENVIEKRVIHA